MDLKRDCCDLVHTLEKTKLDGSPTQRLGALCLRRLLPRSRKLEGFLPTSAMIAEASVVLNALRWASSKRYSRVEVLTDCPSLVRALLCMETVEVFVKLRNFGCNQMFQYAAVTKLSRDDVKVAHTSAKPVMVQWNVQILCLQFNSLS